MPVHITLEQILKIAPNARSSYRTAFENEQKILDDFGILSNKLRIAHFMAQILHECGGLTIQFENLNYSAKRLPQVWPSRFKPKGALNPLEYANNPQKLANEVYGGRMGNDQKNDGYTYRGRGLIQLTGKISYKRTTEILQKVYPLAPDFVKNPDEVLSDKWCLAVAASEWVDKGCNVLADRDDIRLITRKINGGLIGLDERREWLRRTKATWK